eukprot:Pgem_evm1s19409
MFEFNENKNKSKGQKFHELITKIYNNKHKTEKPTFSLHEQQFDFEVIPKQCNFQTLKELKQFMDDCLKESDNINEETKYDNPGKYYSQYMVAMNKKALNIECAKFACSMARVDYCLRGYQLEVKEKDRKLYDTHKDDESNAEPDRKALIFFVPEFALRCKSSRAGSISKKRIQETYSEYRNEKVSQSAFLGELLKAILYNFFGDSIIGNVIGKEGIFGNLKEVFGGNFIAENIFVLYKMLYSFFDNYKLPSPCSIDDIFSCMTIIKYNDSSSPVVENITTTLGTVDNPIDIDSINEDVINNLNDIDYIKKLFIQYMRKITKSASNGDHDDCDGDDIQNDVKYIENKKRKIRELEEVNMTLEEENMALKRLKGDNDNFNDNSNDNDNSNNNFNDNSNNNNDNSNNNKRKIREVEEENMALKRLK